MIDQHGTNGAGIWLPESAARTERSISLSEQDASQIAYDFELLQERLAELEVSLQFEDIGWQRLGAEGETEFSPTFLKRIRGLSRLMFLKNPLINRAVSLQAFYVFGQGIQIAARHPDVNAVVQAFMDDRQNKAELTSQQARTMKEKSLQIEGNIFFVFFTNKTTGRVRVRSIPTDEIADIVTNPDDAREPWYYKRTWTPRSLSAATGVGVGQLQTVYYPDWRYQPSGDRIPTIDAAPVAWDTPVYHIKVGGLDGMRYGVPETYAALDWARAYKAFLEDWVTITRAYARFAWKMTTPGGSRAVAAAKTRLSTTVGNGDTGERNPPAVTGSTFIAGTSGTDMAPIKTAGATTSASDGEHLKLMVAAAFGVPSTFFGDANVGNHATAKTLDRPTELKFVDRQTLWEDVHQDILSYVVDQAALAPRGKLKGALAPNEPGDEDDPRVVLANDPETGKSMDRVVVIDFPPILEHDQAAAISAIVEAATLGGKSPLTLSAKLTTRLLLQVLGIEDIDEVLATLFPEPPADDADPNTDPPNEDDLSPSSSQAPKPEPSTPPAVSQPDGTEDPSQQPPPVQESRRSAPIVTPSDLGPPLALADVDLDELSRVGPDDLAGAERMWREANAGHPEADLFDAKTDEGE